jgi:hypothetical protein
VLALFAEALCRELRFCATLTPPQGGIKYENDFYI